jgi:hypothetical protein
MSIKTAVGWKRAALSTDSKPFRASATRRCPARRQEHHGAGAHHRLVIGDENAEGPGGPPATGTALAEDEAAAVFVTALITPP